MYHISYVGKGVYFSVCQKYELLWGWGKNYYKPKQKKGKGKEKGEKGKEGKKEKKKGEKERLFCDSSFKIPFLIFFFLCN